MNILQTQNFDLNNFLQAAKSELVKHNIVAMKSDSIETLKKDLVKIGGQAGKVAGEKAGTEAGSKINIPRILAEAIAAATEAAERAAKLAQASEQVHVSVFEFFNSS